MEAILRQVEVVRNCQGESTPFQLVPFSPDGDRYNFIFNYCGKSLSWIIMYDLGNLPFPPDFIIPSEPEIFFVPLTQFRSLQNYNIHNTISLLDILYEFLEFYKQYQKAQVKDNAHERVKFQFSLIESEQDISVLLDKPEAEARFLMPVGIDVAAELGVDGLDYLLPKGQTPLLLYLLLIFKDRNNDVKSPPEIMLLSPPSLRKFMIRFQKLPTWTESTVTVDYLDQARENLNSFLHVMKLRKNFLQACITLFGSPLEYDSLHFSRVSFFFNDYEAIAHFTIPDNFPDKHPSIVLYSVTYCKGNPPKPIQAIYDSYPYSPRWPADELVRRIRGFLVEKKFKDFCTDESAKDEKSRS